MRGLTSGAALAALMLGSAGIAHAESGFHLTGSLEAVSVTADADYINDDKPDNGIDGVFEVARVGAQYNFGDTGPFVEANYYSTINGEVESAHPFNGNVLTNWAVLHGWSGWAIGGGWNFGPVSVGADWGQLTRDVETFQACLPDSAVLNLGSSGFCGNLVEHDHREGIRSGSPEADTADSWRVFGSYRLSPHWSLIGSYQAADFGQSVAPLNVTHDAANDAHPDRTPHPPTSFAQDFRGFSIGVGVTF